MKIFKKLSGMLMLGTILVSMFTINVSASSDTVNINTAPVSTIEQKKDTSTTGDKYDPNAELPKVTIDDANNWVDRKGEDVIKFLKVVIQPIATITFIAGIIMTLFGSFGHGGAVSKGIVTMGIAVCMYTAGLFAPEILSFFSRWLAS